MGYAKLLRNRNFPFANIIAKLSRTPKYACNVRFYIDPYKDLPPIRFYIDPLQGPLDCCSYIYICIYICIYIYICMVVRRAFCAPLHPQWYPSAAPAPAPVPAAPAPAPQTQRARGWLLYKSIIILHFKTTTTTPQRAEGGCHGEGGRVRKGEVAGERGRGAEGKRGKEGRDGGRKRGGRRGATMYARAYI